MKFNGFVCDICGKKYTSKYSLYRVKVKSDAFVTFANMDDCFGANRRKIDICDDCVRDFKDFVFLRLEGKKNKDED